MVMDYSRHNPLGFVAPLFILALPILDTAYVTILRLKAGRKIYHGSPDHFPLRLRRRLGGSTTRTVLATYALGVAAGGLGLAGRLYPKADWLPRPLRAKTTLSNAARDPAAAEPWHRYSTTGQRSSFSATSRRSFSS